VFLDIAGAYGSTSWLLFVDRLREVGVPADMLRLTHSYYRRQRMFVKVGRLVSGWVLVTIGLTEGDPMSPLAFIIAIDSTVQRLHSAVLRNGLPVGFMMPDGSQLTSVWYADDGRLFARTVAGMVVLLDLCSELFTAMRFRFNRAPNKSAAQRTVPTGARGRRERVRREQEPPYQLQGGDLPVVTLYKHVGLMSNSGGNTAALADQNKRLAVACATILRQASTAPVRHRSLLLVGSLYRTYWLPKVMYGVGLYAASPPKVVVDMESYVLRMAMAAANTPLVVLRSVLGLPTLQTRYDLERLRVLVRLASGRAGDLARQQLYAEYALYRRLLAQDTAEARVSAAGLWWHPTLQLLRWMDVVCDAEVRARVEQLPPSWERWGEECVAQCAGEPFATLDDTVPVRKAMLEVERVRRQWEIQRSVASLGEVRELVDSPNMAPFIMHTRRDQSDLRVQLRGGRRVLFGHEFFHLDQCPWCTEPGLFTVAHLLRDCPNWEQARMETWQQARQLLVEEGIEVAAGDVQQHRHLWYLVTCGAAVPHTFIGMNLDSPTHFARGPGRATRHLRTSWRAYERLLSVTGVCLRSVVDKTRELLELGNPMWQFGPSAHAPRTTINHHGREKAAIAFQGVGVGAAAAAGDAAGGEDAAVQGQADRLVFLMSQAGREQVRAAVAAVLQDWGLAPADVNVTAVDEAEADLDVDAVVAAGTGMDGDDEEE